MHCSLRLLRRAIHGRNVSGSLRNLERNANWFDQGCSSHRYASSAPRKLETPVFSSSNDTNDKYHLSERQREKMKADIQDDSFDSQPLKSNKVDLYLASLRAGGIEPVLDDLESCKPSIKPPVEHKNYFTAYEEVVYRLCRTFSKAQLRNFCIQYGIERKLIGKKQTKIGYAEWIITKRWGWENMKEVERRRRDKTEVLSKKFTVSPHELFLLLGKDGSDLLQLSTDYKVHIAVESKPLSIKVEGLRGSLKTIESLIALKRKGILQETVQLPLASPMTSSALQRISRLANAFIENVGGHGKVLIYASDNFRLETAKRIIFRAAEQILRRHNVQLLALHKQDAEELKGPVSSNLFAMYPFLSQGANSRGADPMFRCRSVRDWLSHTLAEKENALDSSLVGDVNPVFVDELGQFVTIERLVHDSSLNVQGSPIVKAVTGHILFSGGDAVRKATLLPPLPGRWSVNKFLRWSKENLQRRQFEPCLPSSLFSSVPMGQSFLHRLTYRCRPNISAQGEKSSKFIHFEIGLEAKTKGVREEEAPEDIKSTSTAVVSTSSDESRDVLDYANHQTAVLGTDGTVSVRMGLETEHLFALPERPMDVQLSILDVRKPKDAAKLLDSYFKEFDTFLRNTSSTQPLAPLFLEMEGSTYTLELRASVRRSIENAISRPPTLTFTENEILSVHPPAPSIVRTVTESIFDLDTNHTSLTSELTCDNPSSDEDWNKFLASVDAVTRSAFEPINVNPPQEIIGE